MHRTTGKMDGRETSIPYLLGDLRQITLMSLSLCSHFLHSFNKYLLVTCHVQGTRDIAANKGRCKKP